MFVCRHCGRVEGKPLAICPSCGTWGSFRPFELPQVNAAPPPPRLNLGPILTELIGELPPGSVLLLGGEPGVGKSTLALAVAGALAQARPVVYVCGEEAPEQVVARAKRLGVESPRIRYLSEYVVGRILHAAEGASALVVDSLLALTTRASLRPGSPQAQREAAQEFVRFSRKTGCLTLLITQVSKKGLAGPRLVEHVVDLVLVLTFAADGLRALKVTKNRLGPLPPPLLLRMTSSGLYPLSPAPERE